VQIRIANKQDEAAIRALATAVDPEADIARLGLINLEANYFGHDGAFFVADEEKRILAAAGSRKRTEDLVELKFLAVAADSRHKGLGKQLLTMIVKFARDLDYAAVVCEVDSSSVDLLRFLSANGFAPESKEPIPTPAVQTITLKRSVR